MRAATSSPSLSICVPPCAICPSSAGSSRRSSSNTHGSPRSSASPECSPDHSSARRTGRASCTRRQRDYVLRNCSQRNLHPYPDPMAKSSNPAATKAAKAEAKAARKAASKQRRSQLWQAFQMQRKEDKRHLPYMIGGIVLIVIGAVVAGAMILSTFTMVTLIPLGGVLGALVAFIIFGRRAQKSVYTKAEGQTGAAAWARDNLR